MSTKILKISLLIILLFWFNNSNANYTENELLHSSNNIIKIKWWINIKNIIDNYFIKNKENKEILKKLESKLAILWPKLKNKNTEKYDELKIVINYLNIKIYFALNYLLEKEQKIEEIKIEKKIINKIQQNTLVFPGFSKRYNDKEKTILAWEESVIYAWWAGAFYEKADVSGVRFYITWNNISDLKYSIENSYLYVEWLLLKTSSYSDIEIISPTKASITFDNIENFILPTDSQIDFRLSIKPNLIWYERVWKTFKDLIVSDVEFYDVTGITTGDSIIKIETTNFSSELFSISPAILNIKVINDFNTSYQAKINISWKFWKNRQTIFNSTPVIEISKIKISSFWAEADLATYSLYNTNDSSDVIIGNYNAGIVEFDLLNFTSNKGIISKWNWENYYIKITWISTWLSVTLLRNWVSYNVIWVDNSDEININLKNSINLGYRDF